MTKFYFTFFLLLISIVGGAQQATLSGNITAASSGEEIIGATVVVVTLNKGTAANLYGFYSLTLNPGSYQIRFSALGYTSKTVQVEIKEDSKMDIELTSSTVSLKGAEIIGEKPGEANIESVEMSKVEMNMATIKRIPAFMGEVDVIKAIQLLPGVQTVGEGTNGFYVRGGAVDQNLILLDEAPVYNASHVLGFFSVFNSDALKDVQLYKGGIPAQYGGRLSSVLDVHMKEGNLKKWQVSGGVGTIASRLTVEGPIKKDKGSILISGRRTYLDLFLGLSANEGLSNTKLYFYDTNLKANYKIGTNDRIFMSGYFGRDVLKFADLFEMQWGNATGTFRWNHVYNSKLFSNVTLVYSDYDYNLGQSQGDFNFKWQSEIKDVSAKTDFTYFMNLQNKIQFGASATLHQLTPGRISTSGSNNIFNDFELERNRGMEYAGYVSNEQTITDQLKVIYGLRLSMFQNIGKGTLWQYDDDFLTVDSLVYNSGEVYNTEMNLEPRLGINYKLNGVSSVKASYNRMAQYIQLASNSTSSSPLDVWFLSSPNVAPQLADQVAFGYFRNFKDNSIEASAEVYYKTMTNAIDFKDGADLFLQEKLEGELRFGDARSYGLELMVRKNAGKITGIVSYTLSRSEKNIPDIALDWYPAKYDKTHDFALTANYEINDRMNASINFVYGTGAAVTFPTGRFEILGEQAPIYSERNAERMPHYHRADVSFTWESKKNKDRKWKVERVISIYNVYNRANPYSINFRTDEVTNEQFAEMTYLLPIVPSITLNFTR